MVSWIFIMVLVGIDLDGLSPWKLATTPRMHDIGLQLNYNNFNNSMK